MPFLLSCAGGIGNIPYEQIPLPYPHSYSAYLGDFRHYLVRIRNYERGLGTYDPYLLGWASPVPQTKWKGRKRVPKRRSSVASCFRTRDHLLL